MRHRRRCWPLLLCGLAGLFSGLLALPTPGADPAPKPAPKLDLSKLPPGTIFVVGEDAKDAVLQPGVMVLTPEKYKELLDQLEQLKRQANPDKPEPPSSCILTGRADESTVYLQAVFQFETRRPKTSIALGCQKAFPTAAVLDDGKLPLLPPPGDDGFVVVVETPGNHRLTLDLEVPITGQSGSATDRGFELFLPKTVITRLEQFDVAGSVRDLRINGRWVTASTLASGTNPRRFVALGAADRLTIAWKGPTPQEQAEPVLDATGQIDVRFDDTHVMMEAALDLKVLRGQTKQWQIVIPPVPPPGTLEVVLPANDDRGLELVRPPADAKQPIWTINWKEPSSAPLLLKIRVHQPRGGGRVLVGPFSVMRALRQQGTITVSTPPELRLLPPQTRGDISQRELTDEQRRNGTIVAAFSYWNMPVGPNLGPAPLELTVEKVKGDVETTLAHALKLTADGWRLTTEVEVNPVRTTVDRLEVSLPPGYVPKVGPLLLVEPDIEVREAAPGRRPGVIKLAGKQHRPFKLTLEGLLTLKPPMDGAPVVVELPQMANTIDRGARVSVEVPEDMELTVARESGHTSLPGGRREAIWRSEPSPAKVDLAWRPRSIEVGVECVADVTVSEGKARVREVLRFQFPQEPERQMLLQGLEFPADVTPTADHAALTAQGAGSWLAVLEGTTVAIEYTVPVRGKRARESDTLPVPLLWPAGVNRCQTRVRVWAEPGVQPVLLGGPAWEELPVEIVPERDTLPALVLRADGLSLPLTLRLTEAAAAYRPTTTIDRTLIQVAAPEGRYQGYRCRFLVTRVGGRWIDVEFPSAISGLNLEMYLAGKRVPNPTVIDDQGKETETGRAVRIRVSPELARRPMMLEARYQLAFGRGEGLGRLVTVLAPPRFLGNVYQGPLRWQVGLGADRLPVFWGGEAAFDQRWSWRGPLLAPQPGVTTADLDRWVGGEAVAVAETPTEAAARSVDLVSWQAEPGPVSLVQAPRQIWLLCCSLAFLLIGLATHFAPWKQTARAVVAILVGAAALAAGLWWPTTLSAVLYGIEPGLVVLLGVVVVLWFLQRRYKRQVVFMPGFSRTTAGSSVMRSGSSNRRRPESTVDTSPLKRAAEAGSRQEVAGRKP